MLTSSPSFVRIGEALAQAEERWTARHRAPSEPATRPFTIAISREAGTPGTTVAHEVGSRLHWQVYDHELVEHIAREMGVHTSLLDTIDERHQNWLLECLRGFGGASRVSESNYTRRLIDTLLALAAHGECIIVGRGAPFILPAESTLRVRLVGDVEDRIEQVRSMRGLSRKEAIRWIAETERERQTFIRTHFYRDNSDPKLYDLVINTSQSTVPQVADQIVGALEAAEEKRAAAMH